MSLRGSAKCLQSIQQFNFLFISHNELFQINFFYVGLTFPLRSCFSTGARRLP